MPPMNQMPPARRPGMVGWLIKKGIAKDQKQAELILLVIAVLVIIVSALQWFSLFDTDTVNVQPPPTSPERLL